MIELERDLRIVEAIVSDLKPYLLGKGLYWSLSGGTARFPFPKGTLGGLLIRLHQLDTVSDLLSPEQQERLNRATTEAKHQLKQWAVQAEEKAVREIKARLQSWSVYVEEIEKDPLRYDEEYPTQVQSRVILELLLDWAGRAVDGRGFINRLTSLDQRLSECTEESTFVWDETLAPAFPHDRFWWLYTRPRHAHSSS